MNHIYIRVHVSTSSLFRTLLAWPQCIYMYGLAGGRGLGGVLVCTNSSISSIKEITVFKGKRATMFNLKAPGENTDI